MHRACIVTPLKTSRNWPRVQQLPRCFASPAQLSLISAFPNAVCLPDGGQPPRSQHCGPGRQESQIILCSAGSKSRHVPMQECANPKQATIISIPLAAQKKPARRTQEPPAPSPLSADSVLFIFMAWMLVIRATMNKIIMMG